MLLNEQKHLHTIYFLRSNRRNICLLSISKAENKHIRSMEEIEVSYRVLGFEEAGETTFFMEIPEEQYRRLSAADDDGEILDSDHLSEEMPRMHAMILKAIRENMEEKSLDSDDGLVEKRRSWGALYEEYSEGADHLFMSISDDDDIEYEVNLY